MVETGSCYMQAIVQRAWKEAQRSGRKLRKSDVLSRNEETADATRLGNANSFDRMRRIAPAAIAYLRRHDAIPTNLTICHKGDLDRDLATVGTPSGVLDLLTGKIIRPDEARKRLLTASTGVEYDSHAQHQLLDKILPPWVSVLRVP